LTIPLSLSCEFPSGLLFFLGRGGYLFLDSQAKEACLVGAHVFPALGER